MKYPGGTKKKNSNKYKKQLNKIEGWSRDGSAKKYTNKVCRDNVSHSLYIPTLAFGVAIHTYYIWGTCMQEWKINTWINIKILIAKPYILNQECMMRKAGVGMYSECDTLSLQTLFVHFFALPSLLHPSILFNCFYTCTVLFLVPPGYFMHDYR